jgi:hypothetical protein
MSDGSQSDDDSPMRVPEASAHERRGVLRRHDELSATPPRQTASKEVKAPIDPEGSPPAVHVVKRPSTKTLAASSTFSAPKTLAFPAVAASSSAQALAVVNVKPRSRTPGRPALSAPTRTVVPPSAILAPPKRMSAAPSVAGVVMETPPLSALQLLGQTQEQHARFHPQFAVAVTATGSTASAASALAVVVDKRSACQPKVTTHTSVESRVLSKAMKELGTIVDFMYPEENTCHQFLRHAAVEWIFDLAQVKSKIDGIDIRTAKALVAEEITQDVWATGQHGGEHKFMGHSARAVTRAHSAMDQFMANVTDDATIRLEMIRYWAEKHVGDWRAFTPAKVCV